MMPGRQSVANELRRLIRGGVSSSGPVRRQQAGSNLGVFDFSEFGDGCEFAPPGYGKFGDAHFGMSWFGANPQPSDGKEAHYGQDFFDRDCTFGS